MRVVALALVVLAGCFSPAPVAGQPCNPTDDWCPDPLMCGADKVCHDPNSMPTSSYNMVFVTGTATPQPISNYDTPEQLDAICQNLATRGGLPANTYVAWVSTEIDDARDRLHGARGFVRTDGAPVADTIQNLVDGKMLNPIDFTEHIEPALYDIDVFTQTDADGLFSELTGAGVGDCITDPTSTIAASGQADATIIDWTQHKMVDCSQPQLLYCFGTDKQEALAASEPMPGKLVFLSMTELPGNVGEEMFNAVCDSEAHTHGISTDMKFLALIASGAHAASAIGATSNEGWHRPDQQPAVTASFDMIAPIDVDIEGNYVKAFTWTGIPLFDVTAQSNFALDCNEWDALTGQGNVGNSTRSGTEGYHDDELDCSEPHRVFCIEQ